jgi:hypothetical protein
LLGVTSLQRELQIRMGFDQVGTEFRGLADRSCSKIDLAVLSIKPTLWKLQSRRKYGMQRLMTDVSSSLGISMNRTQPLILDRALSAIALKIPGSRVTPVSHQSNPPLGS